MLGSVYNPLSVSRFMADTGVVMLEGAIGGGGGVSTRSFINGSFSENYLKKHYFLWGVFCVPTSNWEK